MIISYPPQGSPLRITPQPWGVEVTGQWHLGHLRNVYQQHQQNPQATWSQQVFQHEDNLYRQNQAAISSTMWPNAPQGMAMNTQHIRDLERSGILFYEVTPTGYTTFQWNGPRAN